MVWSGMVSTVYVDGKSGRLVGLFTCHNVWQGRRVLKVFDPWLTFVSDIFGLVGIKGGISWKKTVTVSWSATAPDSWLSIAPDLCQDGREWILHQHSYLMYTLQDHDDTVSLHHSLNISPHDSRSYKVFYLPSPDPELNSHPSDALASSVDPYGGRGTRLQIWTAPSYNYL